MRSFAIDEPGSSVRALYATLIGTEWLLTWVYSKYLDEIADGVDKGFRTWTTRTQGLGLDLVQIVEARAEL